MSLDKMTDAELAAIAQQGDMSKYSDAELEAIAGGGVAAEPAKPMTAMETATSAVKNIPASAGRLVGDLAQTVLHPVDTAKGLGRLAAGAAQLLIPGEQGSEQVARNVGKFYKDRYGGLEPFKKTLAEDPVGMAGDAATLLSGGGGLARFAGKAGGLSRLTKAGEALGRAGATIEPIGAATRGTGKLISKSLPDFVKQGVSPEGLYESAMKFSNNPRVLSPVDRRKAIKTGLGGGYLPNEASYNRLWNNVATNRGGVEKIITAGESAGDTIPTADVMRMLAPLETRAGRIQTVYPEFMQVIDEAKAQYATMGDKIPVRVAQTLKETVQDLSKYGTDDRSRFMVGVNKAVGRGLRLQLEQVYPDLAKLNSNSSALLTLENELAKATGRIGNRDLVNLGMKVALGGVGMGSGVMQKSNVILGLIDVPNIKARLAVALHKAQTGQNLPLSKWKQAAKGISSAGAREAMYQAGRLVSGQSDPLGIRGMSSLEDAVMLP